MAHDVFISYSHKDKSTADAICARLERDGIRCWYAPRDITPGAEWAGAIINAIKGSRVMVLIFSDFSNASRQVLREVSYAVQEGVTIIPFRITDTKPTESMEYYLVSVHWLDAISQPLEEKTDELAEKIRGTLGRPAPVAVPEPVVKKDIPAGRDEKAEKKEKKTEYKTAKKAGKDEKNEEKPSGKGKWLLLLLVIPLAAGILWAAGVFGKPETDPGTQPGTEIQETVEPQEPAETEAPAVTEAVAAEPTAAPQAETAAPQDGTTEAVTGNVADFDFSLLSDGSVVITKYLGNAENLVIPEELGGKKVTKIGDSAFYENLTIQKVTLPSGVTEIGDKAFCNCKNLDSATLPEGLLTIGEDAFLSCKVLTDCVIPDTVVSIGKSAFFHCEQMTSFRIPAGVETIHESTFFMCYALKNVDIPEGVKEIGKQAFYACRELENITLPEGLETIGEGAFEYCSAIGSVSIPASVRDISPGAFANCNHLAEFRLADGNPSFEIKDNALYGKEEKRLICYPALQKETVFTVQEGTEIIDADAFYSCSYLAIVNLPDGLKTIGDSAFNYCSGLRRINIPDSVQTIGQNPFAYDLRLSEIQVSEDHPALYLKDGALVSREDQRMVCWILGTMEEKCTVPEGVRIIDEAAFSNTPYLTEIILPDGVTEIGAYAFANIKQAVTIRIPESVHMISVIAFTRSENLTVEVKKNSYAEVFCGDYKSLTLKVTDE